MYITHNWYFFCNCDLNNFYAKYTLVTFKKDPTNSFDIVDKRIPQEYSYGNFYTGRSFNFSFTGYTTTKIPEVERVENWNYEKRYKYKSADMGYAGILLTCISAYIVIDGFGILGEIQKAGADLNISIPQIGMIQTDLTLKFN